MTQYSCDSETFVERRSSTVKSDDNTLLAGIGQQSYSRSVDLLYPL